jgi:hypothetical protein
MTASGSGSEAHRASRRAHELHEAVVDDFDDLLAR